MDVVALNRKKVINFIKTYQHVYGRDPSHSEIKDHLARGAQPEGVSWLNPFEIFLVVKIPLKGVMLM